MQSAQARAHALATVTLPIEMGRYHEQRYALVEALPETGRYRQICKHLHHVSHHIVGDTSHGRGDHNRLWRIHLSMHRMLLHAWCIEFAHSRSGERLRLQAPLDAAWKSVIERFDWADALDGQNAGSGAGKQTAEPCADPVASIRLTKSGERPGMGGIDGLLARVFHRAGREPEDPSPLIAVARSR
ncbi:MAG: hypothetical protein WBV39_12255 [Rudaea sp.]